MYEVIFKISAISLNAQPGLLHYGMCNFKKCCSVNRVSCSTKNLKQFIPCAHLAFTCCDSLRHRVYSRGQLRLNDHGIHILLTLSACIRQAGTAACEYAVHYLTSQVASPWEIKYGAHGTYECRLPMYCAETSQWRCLNCSWWNKSRGESYMISHKNWNYPNWVSLKYFMILNCIHPLITELMSIFRCSSSTNEFFCEWLWHQCNVNELFLHNILWADGVCWGCVQCSQQSSLGMG